MKLGFDLDGVIADGKYLDLSKIPIEKDALGLYETLAPYEVSTPKIWNALCKEHDIWIITARGSGKQSSFKESFISVVDWLSANHMAWRCSRPRSVYR